MTDFQPFIDVVQIALFMGITLGCVLGGLFRIIR